MSSTDSSPLAAVAKLQCCGLTLKDSEDKCSECGRARADLQMDRAAAPPPVAELQTRPALETPRNLESMHTRAARKRKEHPPSVPEEHNKPGAEKVKSSEKRGKSGAANPPSSPTVPEKHNTPGAEQDKPSEERIVFQATTQANIANLFAGRVKR